MNLADLRRDYGQASLDLADADPDPIEQFKRWFADALRAEVPEPNAMTLATATPDGAPSARIVLLKEVTADGFSFFTDYRSRKGADLEANPRAALVFMWKEIERQVRVEGRVTRVSEPVSDAYFAGRPPGSQVGAWASVQSSVLPDRATLERRVAELEAGLAGVPARRPPHWGGYHVVPQVMEFWQGRASRLHDRVRYRPDGDSWIRERLSP